MNALLIGLYVLVLSMFAGFALITKVPPTLHTPLMSGSNAISGIALIGALVVADRVESPYDSIIGVTAVAMATVNVVGGFMVTDRMLRMFRKKKEA